MRGLGTATGTAASTCRAVPGTALGRGRSAAALRSDTVLRAAGSRGEAKSRGLAARKLRPCSRP